MLGIIDIGGGLRGIYGAGVFDRCLEEQIPFDSCIGVSAGSANVASYLGGQKGRNYRFYHEYAFRREYMGMQNIPLAGSYINLDYIYGTLCAQAGEDPLDYSAICANPGQMTVVATDAENGEPVYFGKSDMSLNHYEILSASSALPVVCRPQNIGGKACFDGGVADPIPVEKALRDGCDKIVLILTKPLEQFRPSPIDSAAARLLNRQYPRVALQIRKRFDAVMHGISLAKALEKERKCLILAPNDCCGVHTLTRDKKKLDLLYQKGFHDAQAVQAFI